MGAGEEMMESAGWDRTDLDVNSELLFGATARSLGVTSSLPDVCRNPGHPRGILPGLNLSLPQKRKKAPDVWIVLSALSFSLSEFPF